jgi:hypothetical protein
MTFDEQCHAVAEQVRIFLTDVATGRAMGMTDEHKAALKRMRELGMKPEHIDRIFEVREEFHAQHLAQAEARLAERHGDVH